jgi:site-specific recombinase XerC
VVQEFFASVGNLHPQAIEHTHVRAWRDVLTRRRQKAATVSFKLAVVRSFFGYLIALGTIEKNPADTKFVLPPVLPEDMAGRALTSEKVPGRTAASRKARGTTRCCW